jgi:cyclophilin family peptidyl-prolyl cis-trans isomerase
MLFAYIKRSFSKIEFTVKSIPLEIGTRLGSWALFLRIKESLFILLSLIIVARYVAAAEPPFTLPHPLEIRKLRSAIIQTSKGELVFRLFPESAPWHVANFKYLADKGFYRGLSFTGYYPKYLIQGGRPSVSRSGPGWSISPEFNRHSHQRGALGMARVRDDANPERRSNGSQFHIILSDSPHMDQNYTVFGQLIGGWKTLDQLRAGDIIDTVKVFVVND